MNRKIGYFFLMLILTTISVRGQQIHSIFTIRDYKHSLLLEFRHDGVEHSVIDAWGKLTNSTVNSNYLYQGHEYDQEVGLYNFYSRLYSSSCLRFLQPDPKSQFHSPYLFVGSDPINFIDHDGKASKPLILYAEDHTTPKGVDYLFDDFLNEVPDAYKIPLSKFMNQEVGDLSEWNGNVYIEAHMNTEEGKEILASKSRNVKDLNPKLPGATMELEEGEHVLNADAFQIGRQLRMLSNMKKIPIKSVVAGGCQGSAAAKRIALGFTADGRTRTGNTLLTYGVKKGKQLSNLGKTTFTRGNMVGPDRVKMFIAGQDDEQMRHSFLLEDGREEVQQITKLDPITQQEIPYYEIEGQQIQDFVNGRIPSNMMKDMNRFRAIY